MDIGIRWALDQIQEFESVPDPQLHDRLWPPFDYLEFQWEV